MTNSPKELCNKDKEINELNKFREIYNNILVQNSLSQK